MPLFDIAESGSKYLSGSDQYICVDKIAVHDVSLTEYGSRSVILQCKKAIFFYINAMPFMNPEVANGR